MRRAACCGFSAGCRKLPNGWRNRPATGYPLPHRRRHGDATRSAFCKRPCSRPLPACSPPCCCTSNRPDKKEKGSRLPGSLSRSDRVVGSEVQTDTDSPEGLLVVAARTVRIDGLVTGAGEGQDAGGDLVGHTQHVQGLFIDRKSTRLNSSH